MGNSQSKRTAIKPMEKDKGQAGTICKLVEVDHNFKTLHTGAIGCVLEVIDYGKEILVELHYPEGIIIQKRVRGDLLVELLT